MKLTIKLTALLTVIALTLTVFSSCGDKPSQDNTATHEAIAFADMKIGVLFTDNAVSMGDSYYHITGIENAAKELSLDTTKQIVYKKNITDVTFDESASFVPETAATETETAKETKEPETFLDANGNPVIEAVPVEKKAPETALQAVSSLLEDGCNIIIATDAVYDSFTQYIAKQNKDIIVLQFKGTSTDIPNLYNYDANVFEGFYLAGAVSASVSASGTLGFIGGQVNDESKENVNAFALGASSVNKDAKVILRNTNVPFDLGLERLLPEQLISEDGCDVLAQGVYTALPQTVAENEGGEYKNAPTPCIGFGYDMSADAKNMNICSVIIDYGVCFSEVLTSLNDGKFTNGSFTGTAENGGVYLSEIRKDAEKLTSVVENAKKALSEAEDIFSTVGENGYTKSITVK